MLGKELKLKKMTKLYYEALPKKLRIKVRCQHLDKDGSRCKKTAEVENSYCGDPEIYKYKEGWGVVNLCEEHKAQ
jgi:hypothetical protein